MFSDQPEDIIDISGLSPSPDATGADSDGAPGRRWLGVTFECCSVYQRIYRNKSGTAYVGRCPKCTREIQIPIGPEGTDARFFRAT